MAASGHMWPSEVFRLWVHGVFKKFKPTFRVWEISNKSLNFLLVLQKINRSDNMEPSWRKGRGEPELRSRCPFRWGGPPSDPHSPHHFLTPWHQAHLTHYHRNLAPAGIDFCNPRFTPFCPMQLTFISRGPTVFMICYLEMTISCVDTRPTTQQKSLPLGCICKQFIHTPIEVEIWQPSGMLQQRRCAVRIFFFFFTPKWIYFGGPDSQIIQLDIPT